MTAVPVEKHLQLIAPPRPALHPVDHTATPFEAAGVAHEDFQPWEIHSELVLVDPELRRRSLKLLPEIDLDAVPDRPPQSMVHAPLAAVAAPRPIILRSPLAHTTPIVAPAPVEDEPVVESIGIVGAVFALAMLAELVAR